MEKKFKDFLISEGINPSVWNSYTFLVKSRIEKKFEEKKSTYQKPKTKIPLTKEKEEDILSVIDHVLMGKEVLLVRGSRLRMEIKEAREYIHEKQRLMHLVKW